MQRCLQNFEWAAPKSPRPRPNASGHYGTATKLDSSGVGEP